MHLIAGKDPRSFLVESVTVVGGVVRSGVTEVDDEAGFLIRIATEEEVERLVTRPGLVWPRDCDVLIMERGKIEIVLREGEP